MSFCAVMICADVAFAPSGIAGAVGAGHWSCAIAGAVSAMNKAPPNKILRIMCCLLSADGLTDFLHPETRKITASLQPDPVDVRGRSFIPRTDSNILSLRRSAPAALAGAHQNCGSK